MTAFSAEPTKDFFIEMLTKDIPLDWAILDLIDNSVDGARDQISKHTSKTLKDSKAYDGYEIKLTFNKDQFIIEDNCGGFSKEAAENYAFKFGRPKNQTAFPKGSVGRFGVGMKRGIFKIGNHFVVETKSSPDHFIVEENIEKWNVPQRGWDFNFVDVLPGIKYVAAKPILVKDGTYIKVTELHDAVKLDFSSAHFQKNLISEIQRILSYSIERGLKIIVNEIQLEAKPIGLLVSEELVPYFFEDDINNVNIRIYAGISAPNPNDAGWYIFCNDRLMIDHDKSNLTGWEGNEKFYGDSGVQKFHNKVAMFRGLVFFNSDDSKALPMTTTKTGIDVNSTIYKTTRSYMINAMKIVLSYLNKLENDEQRQYIVKNSKSVDIISFDQKKLSNKFVFPVIKKNTVTDNSIRITYKVERDTLEVVKRSINKTNKDEVGLATFKYYIKMKELDV